MANALVRAVIHVDKQRFPIVWKRRVIHSIAVILRRDEATVRTHLTHRLVVRAMTVFQFVGLSSCRTSQQLIAQADAHTRTHSLTPSPSLTGEGSRYFF